MFTKKDFVSYSQYIERLSKPVESSKNIPVSISNTDKNNNVEEVDDDFEYEMYKLNWMIRHGYTLYDFVESYLPFVEDQTKKNTVFDTPSDALQCWEEERGFLSGESGDSMDIYDDYDTWVCDHDQDDMDEIAEISDYIEAGITPTELVVEYGYPSSTVEKAVQYMNFMK